MKFQGLTDYPAEPTAMRVAMQRQNGAVREALEALERERAARPVPRTVTGNTAATHDEALRVIADARIVLPRSEPSKAFRTVTVVATRTGLVITVAAAAGNHVQGVAEDSFSGFAGLRRYEDDGQGNWWVAI